MTSPGPQAPKATPGRLLTRGELLASVRVQVALATGRSALTAAVLRCHARALSAGPSALQELLCEGLARRPFVHPWQAALLMAAAVHFQVLGSAPGRGSPLCRLAALYPSAGGDFSAIREAALDQTLWRALSDLAAQRPADWSWFLSQGSLQTSEPSRAMAWVLPALTMQQRRMLPLDLVELGAGAGALLVGDLFSGERRVPLVERRVGIDPAPPDSDDPFLRRCQRACIWADQVDRLRRLDASFAALATLKTHGHGPVMVPGDMVEVLPGVISRLCTDPAHKAGPRRLIIYNVLSTRSLSDETYARLQGRILRSLMEWFRRYGEEALWIEMEPPRTRFENRVEVRASRLNSSALEPILLGSLPLYPQSERDFCRNEAGWRRLLGGP